MKKSRVAAAAALGLGIAGSLAYYNAKRLSIAGGKLTSSLSGEDLQYNWRGWKLSYNKRGSGRPLILLHGIYATASNFEMRRAFELFSSDFTVFAPDLLGFGRSARPNLDYTDKIYIALIRDFIRDVAGPGAVVLASSLTGSYAIEIAAREPELISKLVLVEPTGLRRLVARPTPGEQLWHRVLGLPLVGENVLSAVASKESIRRFLEAQIYADKSSVNDSVVDQSYRAAHQPGAKWAPISFLTGWLNHNVRFALPQLNIPTLVVRGSESRFAGLEEMVEFTALNKMIDYREVENSGSLPHDERAVSFYNLVQQWLFELPGEIRSA